MEILFMQIAIYMGYAQNILQSVPTLKELLKTPANLLYQVKIKNKSTKPQICENHSYSIIRG